MNKPKSANVLHLAFSLDGVSTGVSTAQIIYQALVTERDRQVKESFIHYTKWLKTSDSNELDSAALSWASAKELEVVLDELVFSSIDKADSNYWANQSDVRFNAALKQREARDLTQDFLKEVQADKKELQND